MAEHEPRRLSCMVTSELEGRTVRNLLKTQFHMADGFIAALKLRPDGILLEGERVRTNARVRAGECLSVRVDDTEGGNPAAPVPIPLCVRYEDADLAVIEKPAGMVIHGSDPDGPPTLANALAALWGGEQPFHPIQRLDRGTTGLLLVAKSRYVSELLRRSLHTEDFAREYLALVRGAPEPPAGTIKLPIGPETGKGTRRCVRQDGQAALTAYETLSNFPGGALLRLRLYTGRTHQIRVHLSAKGCPLFGDPLYGGPAAEGLDRPALHAASLSLKHPVTGERFRWESPLPADMRGFLEKREKGTQPEDG